MAIERAILRKVHKTFEIKVLDKRTNGGRVLINTASVDRDHDRVLPQGVRVANYLKNPVVQWGHNYKDPWATIGRSSSLEIGEGGIVAEFELRPPANDQDPQNVVRLLWEGDWVNAASIGFVPVKQPKQNELGGLDFEEWELLEWSLVPIPSNQDALRLAVKGLDVSASAFGWLMNIQKGTDENIAWIRRLTVESMTGVQTVFACFRAYEIAVPADAEKWMADNENGIYPAPHPHAGKTIQQKEVTFVPPIEFEDECGKTATYFAASAGGADEELVKGADWDVVEMSEPLLALPKTKSITQRAVYALGVCKLVDRDVRRVKSILSRAHSKRGRVLSSKNESSLRSAQEDIDTAKAKIDGVLKQLDEQPDGVEPRQESSSKAMDTGAMRGHLDGMDEAMDSMREHVDAMHGMMDEEEGAGSRSQDASERARKGAKGAIVPHTTPQADEDAEWDAAAVLREVEGERQLRLVHAWVDDDGDPEVKSSYKLPHHYADGRVVWRGVAAAGAALMGGRGGVNIPESDVAGVKAHLARHYGQFDKTPPWEQEESLGPASSADERAAGDATETPAPFDERALAEQLDKLVQTLKEVF